jgi:hypothetical protein
MSLAASAKGAPGIATVPSATRRRRIAPRERGTVESGVAGIGGILLEKAVIGQRIGYRCSG